MLFRLVLLLSMTLAMNVVLASIFGNDRLVREGDVFGPGFWRGALSMVIVWWVCGDLYDQA